ncbi:MAG: fumarylacetoacetate hydrolase family protein [Chloroflexota bacterium]
MTPLQNLFLVQYNSPAVTGALGLDEGDGISPLISAGGQAFTLNGLLSADAPRAAELASALQRASRNPVDRTSLTLQAPVAHQEVWAAGVTYKRSEEARESESNNSTIYSRVYSAVRPELFFKSTGEEVVGLGEAVGIRSDASWSVPEPELVVVLNAHLEVVGFTIGNDMSSRDIEGENPLYLPQAKNYERACALGPRIWLQPGATTWPDVAIDLKIERGGQVVFSGATSTTEIHRPLSELIDYLGRCKRFPRGVLLFTGTGIVPPDSFTLLEGDTVRIRIDPIGELVNTVRVVGQG